MSKYSTLSIITNITITQGSSIHYTLQGLITGTSTNIQGILPWLLTNYIHQHSCIWLELIFEGFDFRVVTVTLNNALIVFKS